MILDKSKNLPQMLIWHGVHAKATGDIQAPHLCPGRGFFSPPAVIWLLEPSELTSLQKKVGYVSMSCPPGKQAILGFMAKGQAEGVLLHG